MGVLFNKSHLANQKFISRSLKFNKNIYTIFDYYYHHLKILSTTNSLHFQFHNLRIKQTLKYFVLSNKKLK